MGTRRIRCAVCLRDSAQNNRNQWSPFYQIEKWPTVFVHYWCGIEAYEELNKLEPDSDEPVLAGEFYVKHDGWG